MPALPDPELNQALGLSPDGDQQRVAEGAGRGARARRPRLTRARPTAPKETPGSGQLQASPPGLKGTPRSRSRAVRNTHPRRRQELRPRSRGRVAASTGHPKPRSRLSPPPPRSPHRVQDSRDPNQNPRGQTGHPSRWAKSRPQGQTRSDQAPQVKVKDSSEGVRSRSG